MNVTAVTKKFAIAGLTGLFAIGLTGCFGDDDADGDPSASPSASVTPARDAFGTGGGAGGGGSGGSEPDETGQPGSEPDSEPDAQAEPAALEGAECVYGEWLADNNSALAGMTQFGDQIKSLEGNVYVTYNEDGTFTTDYQDWTISAHQDGVDITIHRHGLDQGTFSATDTTITQRDETMGAVITMTSPVGTLEVPAEPAAYVDAPYTCTATELVLSTPDGEGRLTR